MTLPQEQILQLSGAELVSRMRERSLRVPQVANSFLARIDECEADVQAWQYIHPEAVRATADELDGQSEAGLLYGLPIGIKDIIDTHDMPTGLGSPVFSNRQAGQDAYIVERLRQAGAIAFGKTVTTEFAYFSPGKTRNPHDLSRTPGGSSSGSAAAVAARMVPVAIATQAAGSTIRPASFCGIWAFKPTFGRWPIRGSLKLYETLDTLSVYANVVEDLILIDRVVAKEQGVIPVVQAPRIAVFDPPASHQSRASNEWQAAVKAASEKFIRAGAQLERVTAPDWYEACLASSETVLMYEAVRGMAFVPDDKRPQLSKTMRDLLSQGSTISESQYREALEQGDYARSQADALFERYDALLAPGATAEAPVGIQSTGDPIFIRTWNFLHVPSANAPAHHGSNDLPLGVQLIAGRGKDEHLLAVLRWAEAALAD